jgi:ketosteroid isomerase-like protein
MNNFDRFNEMLGCFLSNDEAGARDFLADDFEFVNIGTKNMPWYDTGKGADGFLRFLGKTMETTTSESMDVLWHLEDGELCVIRGREKLRVNSTGILVDIQIIWETRWRDGKCIYLREFYETKKLDDAFSLASEG